jgi:hypothetical protein
MNLPVFYARRSPSKQQIAQRLKMGYDLPNPKLTGRGQPSKSIDN